METPATFDIGYLGVRHWLPPPWLPPSKSSDESPKNSLLFDIMQTEDIFSRVLATPPQSAMCFLCPPLSFEW